MLQGKSSTLFGKCVSLPSVSVPPLELEAKKTPILARLQLQMLKMSTLRSTVSISVNMMCPVQRPQVVFFKKEALETWGKKEKTR